MTPERYRRIRAVLDRRQPDLTVLLEHVHKPHNLSAILRTCDAVGVLEAHAVRLAGRLRRGDAAASGAGKWVDVRTHAAVEPVAADLRARGMQIVAAHLSPRAVDFRAVDYTRPTAVLLGTEKWGVSEGALACADREIVIPMAGMVASLNVSVAAAVILFEAQRQRTAAGLYDRCRLDAETYQRTLFRWGYPRLAACYERRGEPFPPIDIQALEAESPLDTGPSPGVTLR